MSLDSNAPGPPCERLKRKGTAMASFYHSSVVQWGLSLLDVQNLTLGQNRI